MCSIVLWYNYRSNQLPDGLTALLPVSDIDNRLVTLEGFGGYLRCMSFHPWDSGVDLADYIVYNPDGLTALWG